MAFKFKLEKVLDYRKQLEEQAMQALASARQARDAARQRLEEMQGELAEQQAKMSDSAAMDGAERWLVQSYIKALQQDIPYTIDQLVLLEEEAQRCQEHLIAKAQERKLLEKFKDKQAKRFAGEEKLKEQRDNDETSTIRYQKEAL